MQDDFIPFKTGLKNLVPAFYFACLGIFIRSYEHGQGRLCPRIKAFGQFYGQSRIEHRPFRPDG
jgi:hypothetical protein